MFPRLESKSSILAAATRPVVIRRRPRQPPAALTYQHAMPERDRALADALSVLAGTEAERTRRAPQPTR
jgi:hypothetical protein